MIQVHKSEDRGEMNIGWLHARYSFSFARYFNQERNGIGPLRVWNHDVVAPSKGFEPHSHRDFEIITIPLRGSIAHTDSINDSDAESAVSFGEVQTMSAGTGVTHSEFNASDKDDLELFQVWIETEVEHREPQYDTASYKPDMEGIQVIASRDGGGGYIESSSVLKYVYASGNEIVVETKPDHSYFLMPIKGEVFTTDLKAEPFSSLEVEEESISITFGKESQSYLLEMPKK